MDGLSEARLRQIRDEFSLGSLEKFESFKHFTANSEIETTSEGVRVKIWFEDQVKISELTNGPSGEKLGYDPSSDTWFYEKWSDSSYIKSWKSGTHEWGESCSKNSTSETKENWNFIDDEESYEHYQSAPSSSYGSKSGKKNGLSWKEIWHKKPEDSGLEKFWISDSAKWGEKEGETGSRKWSLKWREAGSFYEETSTNAEPSKEWGHISGRDTNKEWGEQWSIFLLENKKSNDRWWKEGEKKWGIKTENDSQTEFCEEWEEKNDTRKSTKNFKDSLGTRTQYTEGTGPGYKFTVDYTYEPELDKHTTKKKGESSQGKWESFITQQGSKHHVWHRGEDENGNWEEIWDEDGGCKKAYKKGFSKIDGKWEEEWEENDGKKYCKKWGENNDQWVEEWTEEGSKKSCKKQQFKFGKHFVQEWEEVVEDNVKHSVGHFLEDGVEVKKWDTLDKLVSDDN